MPRTTQRNSKNNNPEGHNQYDRGIIDSARERPFTAAAAVGGVVAAGVFLWSRRNQLSEQIGQLGDQIGEWRDGMSGNNSPAQFQSDSSSGAFMARRSSGQKSQQEIAEEALTLKETGQASSPTTTVG